MLDIDRHTSEFLCNEYFVLKGPAEAMSVKPKKTSEAVNVVDEKKESVSLLSRLTRILIATNLLPVKLNSDQTRAKFKIFSLKTVSYLLVTYSPFLIFGVNFLFPSNYLTEYADNYREIYSPFDMIWIILFNVVSYTLAPTFMLIVANAFVSLTDISLSKGRSH